MSSRWANSQKRSNNTHHVSSNGEYKIYNSQKLDFFDSQIRTVVVFPPPSKSECTPWDGERAGPDPPVSRASEREIDYSISRKVVDDILDGAGQVQC